MATPIDDDTLQRFYDGELSELEAHGVQLRLESDPAAQRRLVQLTQLTSLMRAASHELEGAVDSVALFAGIEAELGKQTRVGFGARLRLVASEWVEHRRAALVPLVTASAVAAATLLLVLRPNEYGGIDRTQPSTDAVETPSELAQETPNVAPSAADLRSPAGGRASTTPAAVHGSRVENVDFGASTGTVFELEDQGVAVAVVWITDDDELEAP